MPIDKILKEAAVVPHLRTLVYIFFIIAIPNYIFYAQSAEISITTKSEDALKSYNHGLELLSQLHFQLAITDFENAVGIDKDFAMSYLQMALAFYGEENFSKYIENVDKAVGLVNKVSDGERLIILIEKAKLSHNSDEMKKLLKQLVEKFPDDKLSYYYFGIYYFNQGNYTNAIKEFEKSQKIVPGFIPVLNLLAYSNSYTGNYFKAKELMNKIVQIIPDESMPYYLMGDVYLKEGKFTESLEAYKKALEKNPEFVSAYLGIGNNLIFQNKNDEARIEFEKSYNLSKDEWQKRSALLSIVCSYIHEGKYEIAYDKLQNRYSIAEKSNDILQMVSDLRFMGDILLEWGKPEDARIKYKKSVDISEKSTLPKEIKEDIKHQVLFADALIDIKNNNISAARQKAEKFNNEVQKNNNIIDIRSYHELLGLISLQEKNYDEAINEFKLSDQRDPCVLCKSAEAYLMKGDNEMAKELWTKAGNFNENSIHFAFVKNNAVKNLAQINK